MGKISVAPKAVKKITVILSAMEEVAVTYKNVTFIRSQTALTVCDYQQIVEKINKLAIYFETHKETMTQTEKDMVLKSMLTLFLLRRGKLADADKKLDELSEQFSRERGSRWLI